MVALYWVYMEKPSDVDGRLIRRVHCSACRVATLANDGEHAVGNWREPTRYNGQTANRQKPEFISPFKIRTSATTCGYYRTSSPVTALPMIMR
jgi:hypothetical protein